MECTGCNIEYQPKWKAWSKLALCPSCRVVRDKEYERTRHREYAQSHKEERRAIEKRRRGKRKRDVAWWRAYRALPENVYKNKARNAVYHAVAKGRLSRGPCEVCGATKGVHGHHDDYSKPLDVRWLCHTHHVELHARERAGASA